MTEYRSVGWESVLSVRPELFGSSRDLQNCIKVEKEGKAKRREKTEEKKQHWPATNKSSLVCLKG